MRDKFVVKSSLTLGFLWAGDFHLVLLQCLTFFPPFSFSLYSSTTSDFSCCWLSLVPLFPHCSLSTAVSLLTNTQTCSEELSLCCSRYTLSSLSLNLSLNLSLSATNHPRAKSCHVSVPTHILISPNFSSSHCLRVIFQIWPLIGSLLRLSQ